MRPLVSTTSLLDAKAEDGVHGPIVGAPLVMLKLMTQPPAPIPAPHELDGIPAKSQSVVVLEL